MIKIIKKKFIDIMISVANSKKRAEIYRNYYGVKIGDNVRFTGKPDWGAEPFLIEIGNDVTITQDVYFITHDGGVGLFRKEYPGINIFGNIKIGNNVFIGARTIILPGVNVGNNVIIAAGSVVTKDILENTVVAGVPARVVRTLKEYKEKMLVKAIFLEQKNFLKRKEEIIEKMKSKK